MTDLAQATDRLTIRLRATTRGRADALLDPGHGFRRDQLTTVMDLADELIPADRRARVGEEDFFAPARVDDENFSWLARWVGLHSQDDWPSRTVRQVANRPVLARLFALLLLASRVYDGNTGPTLINVADLRRLADIVRARSGRQQLDISLDNLRAEFRRLHRLADGDPVSTEQLRELIGQVRLAKAALARHDGLAKIGRSRHVTHTDLAEVAPRRRSGGEGTQACARRGRG